MRTLLEALVLRTVKHLKDPVGEYRLHEMMRIAQNFYGNSLYIFYPRVWEDVCEGYRTGQGALPYSDALHETVQTLVRKNYLARAPENPIVIYPDMQLKLF